MTSKTWMYMYQPTVARDCATTGLVFGKLRAQNGSQLQGILQHCHERLGVLLGEGMGPFDTTPETCFNGKAGTDSKFGLTRHVSFG